MNSQSFKLTWVRKWEVKLDNWDEVLSELNRIAEELAEKETMETLDDANNMNFDVTKAA